MIWQIFSLMRKKTFCWLMIFWWNFDFQSYLQDWSSSWTRWHVIHMEHSTRPLSTIGNSSPFFACRSSVCGWYWKIKSYTSCCSELLLLFPCAETITQNGINRVSTKVLSPFSSFWRSNSVSSSNILLTNLLNPVRYWIVLIDKIYIVKNLPFTPPSLPLLVPVRTSWGCKVRCQQK